MPTPTLRHEPLILLLGLAMACSGDAGPASRGPVVPEWTLEQEGRIGSLDDPDQLLDDVDQVVIGPDEQLFVPQAHEIWVFDATGARVGTIGREGEGPGEFASLGHVGLVGGDTLYTTHGGQVGYFTLDGRFLTSTALTADDVRQLPRLYSPRYPMALVPLPDRGFLITPGIAVMGPRTEPGINRTDFRWPVFRLDSSSAIQDTVFWQESTSTFVGVSHEGNVVAYGNPFFDLSLFELMPDARGVVVVERPAAPDLEPSTYRVTLIDPDRDTVFSAPVPYVPEAVPSDLLAAKLVELAGRRENGPDAGTIEGALRDADLIPATLPPVTDLAVGQDGTIWIKREETLAEAVLWQVLGPAGELQGQLYLPQRQTVLTAEGDLMVAVELDLLDVPYIVRYRIVR